jgi:hypothetical protein
VRIRRPPGRDLSGGDDGLDLLRAACAAIWQSGTAIHALDVPPVLYGLRHPGRRSAIGSAGRGSVGLVSAVDDEGREPDASDPTTSTDAAGGASNDPADEPRPDPDDNRNTENTAALQDIESKPLARARPGYQALADRLRAELEQSDPSRGSS